MRDKKSGVLSEKSEHSNMLLKRMNNVYNLPNMLTISRIVVIPVIFLAIYIQSVTWSVLTAVLFIVAAITDYFDGYLARSRNETSALGRLLDPIADKLLVVSALLIIVANGMVNKISYIPVVIILCREVLVSGLREFLAEVKVGMPVTRLAKWKTAFQMTALSLILLGKVSEVFAVSGEVLLWVAGVLTFITGYQYFEKGLAYVRGIENPRTIKEEVREATQKAFSAVAKVKQAVKAKAVKNVAPHQASAQVKPSHSKPATHKKPAKPQGSKKAAPK